MNDIKILCYSRSYLSKLYPILDVNDKGRTYYHIVQTNAEEKRVSELGGTVILNIQKLVEKNINNKSFEGLWDEPSDFREITSFNWSPVLSDRYLINLRPDTREQVAAIVYDGISKLFDEYDFDYFFSEPVTLFAIHAMYYLCKKHDVGVRFMIGAYKPGYFYFSDSMNHAEPVKTSDFQVEKDGFGKELLDYCNGIIEDKSGPAYHYAFSSNVKNDPFKLRTGDASYVVDPGGKRILVQLLRLSRAFFYKTIFPFNGDYYSAASVKEQCHYLKCLFTKRSYYDEQPLEYSSKRLFFPLQFEPEASLIYAAPENSNQFSFIERVVAALPKGVELYIKEHPNQFGALGSRVWRNLRQRHPNVKFIYGRESGRELLRKCNAAVVISSTAGMDALLMKKKVVVLGNVYYENFPGAIKVNSIGALSELLNNNFFEDVDNSKQFKMNVDALGKMSHYYYTGTPAPSSRLYSEESISALVSAIDKECSGLI